MHPDVLDLKQFYASPLGLTVRRIVAHRIRARWRNVRGQSIAGLGYATPFLRPFLAEASCVTALMPQAQGVIGWPAEGPHVSVLVDETRLPLPDASLDLALMAHCLEHAEASRGLLREMWRVLKPEGKLTVIVPNRRGLWARGEATPFGQGRPFTRGQIEQLLTRSLFAPECVTHALFAPPITWGPVVKTAIAWERAGALMWPLFSGIIIVEASKQVYAGLKGERVKRAFPRLAVINDPQWRARSNNELETSSRFTSLRCKTIRLYGAFSGASAETPPARR